MRTIEDELGELRQANKLLTIQAGIMRAALKVISEKRKLDAVAASTMQVIARGSLQAVDEI